MASQSVETIKNNSESKVNPENIDECMIKVKVDNKELQAHVDSGATHSIIGPSLFDKLPQLKNKLVNVFIYFVYLGFFTSLLTIYRKSLFGQKFLVV